MRSLKLGEFCCVAWYHLDGIRGRSLTLSAHARRDDCFRSSFNLSHSFSYSTSLLVHPSHVCLETRLFNASLWLYTSENGQLLPSLYVLSSFFLLTLLFPKV